MTSTNLGLSLAGLIIAVGSQGCFSTVAYKKPELIRKPRHLKADGSCTELNELKAQARAGRRANHYSYAKALASCMVDRIRPYRFNCHVPDDQSLIRESVPEQDWVAHKRRAFDKCYGRAVEEIEERTTYFRKKISALQEKQPQESFLYLLEARLYMVTAYAIDTSGRLTAIDLGLATESGEGGPYPKPRGKDMYDKALSRISKVLTLTKNSGWPYQYQAEILARTGECSQAVTVLDQLEKRGWKRSGTKAIRAYCKLKERASGAAVRDLLKEAIDIDDQPQFSRWAKMYRDYTRDAEEKEEQFARIKPPPRPLPCGIAGVRVGVDMGLTSVASDDRRKIAPRPTLGLTLGRCYRELVDWTFEFGYSPLSLLSSSKAGLELESSASYLDVGTAVVFNIRLARGALPKLPMFIRAGLGLGVFLVTSGNVRGVDYPEEVQVGLALRPTVGFLIHLFNWIEDSPVGLDVGLDILRFGVWVPFMEEWGDKIGTQATYEPNLLLRLRF
jgi:tetratricopeptide (TPR) repeat protein